jgi:hypothetical protein
MLTDTEKDKHPKTGVQHGVSTLKDNTLLDV